jgi:hypothetical protein
METFSDYVYVSTHPIIRDPYPMCDELIESFEKLSLDKEDVSFINNAEIYQIKHPRPGRGFRLWKKTGDATFYKNESTNELKVYHHSVDCFSKSKNSEKYIDQRS